MWLICSNRELYHKKNDLLATMTLHNNLDCHRLSDHIHCINRYVDVDGIDSRTVCPWSVLPGYTLPQGGPNGCKAIFAVVSFRDSAA